jgi:hypothetical protein
LKAGRRAKRPVRCPCATAARPPSSIRALVLPAPAQESHCASRACNTAAGLARRPRRPIIPGCYRRRFIITRSTPRTRTRGLAEQRGRPAINGRVDSQNRVSSHKSGISRAQTAHARTGNPGTHRTMSHRPARRARAPTRHAPPRRRHAPRAVTTAGVDSCGAQRTRVPTRSHAPPLCRRLICRALRSGSQGHAPPASRHLPQRQCPGKGTADNLPSLQMWPTRHGVAAWDTHAPLGGPGGGAAAWTALLALGLLALAATFVLLQGVQARPLHGDGVSTDETSVHTTLCVECGWWMSPRDYRAHSRRLLCEVTNSRPVRKPPQVTTSGAAPRPHGVPCQEQQPQAHHPIAGGAGPSSTPSAANDTGAAWEVEAYLLRHMSGRWKPGQGIRVERKGHETQFRKEALESPLPSTPPHTTPHHTPPLTDAALKGLLKLMEGRSAWTPAPGGPMAWRQLLNSPRSSPAKYAKK